MTERTLQPSFTAASHQPLISIVIEEDGETIVHYFTDEEQADAIEAD